MNLKRMKNGAEYFFRAVLDVRQISICGIVPNATPFQ